METADTRARTRALGLVIALAACQRAPVADRRDGGAVDLGTTAQLIDVGGAHPADADLADAGRVADAEAAPDRLSTPDAEGTGLAPDATSLADALTSGDDIGSRADASDPPSPPRFATPPLPSGLGRGLEYVRTHPMFVSALSVQMTPADPAAVRRYTDDFHATAAHLWATGTPDELAGWQLAGPLDWVSWVFEDGRSGNGLLIGGLAANAAGRIGFQVGDEPKTAAALAAIQAGILAVRGVDPEALIFTNLCCADEIDVEATVESLVHDAGADLVSYDQYATGRSAYEALAVFRAAALARGVPYWRYLRSYLAPGQDLSAVDESDLRWDAFSGVSYGYTGHSWFLYQVPVSPDLRPLVFGASNDLLAAATRFFDVIAALNVMLRNFGETLNQLTSTDVRYVSSISPLLQPPHTEAWHPGAGGDPFLSHIAAAPRNLGLDLVVGFFVDGNGERYFTVQSARHLHGDFPVASAAAGTAELRFDFSRAPPSLVRAQLLSLDAASGALITVPLTGTGGAQAQLSLSLEAGELRLFKYDTGAPFARRAGTY